MATSLNYTNNTTDDGDEANNGNHHDNDWRRRRNTIQDRLLLYLTYNEIREGDVMCILGSNDTDNGQQQLRIKTFKVLLIAQSNVFHKMFNECHSNTPSTVKFASMEKDGQGGYTFRDSDVQPRAFQTFLKMLFKDDSTMMNYMTNNKSIYWTVKQVLDLLYIAKKYAVYSLADACETFLMHNLTAQNVLLYFDKMTNFSNVLKQTTVNLMCSNINSILNHQNIVSLSKESLSEILSSDKLILSEVKLFDYLCRWTEFQCDQKKLEKTDKNMREVCGDLLLKIRFPIMSLGEFDQLKYKNMLTATEALELFKYISASPHYKNSVELRRRGFNVEPRGTQNNSTSQFYRQRQLPPRLQRANLEARNFSHNNNNNNNGDNNSHPHSSTSNASSNTTTTTTTNSSSSITTTNSNASSSSSNPSKNSTSIEEMTWNEWEPQTFYIQDVQDVSLTETYVCAGDPHFLEITCEKRIKVESIGFFGSASTNPGQWYNVATEYGNPPQKKNQRIDASHIDLFRVPLNPPAIIEPNTTHRITFSLEGENPLHRSSRQPNESDVPEECMQIYGGGSISFRHDAVALANIQYKVQLQ